MSDIPEAAVEAALTAFIDAPRIRGIYPPGKHGPMTAALEAALPHIREHIAAQIYAYERSVYETAFEEPGKVPYLNGVHNARQIVLQDPVAIPLEHLKKK